MKKNPNFMSANDTENAMVELSYAEKIIKYILVGHFLFRESLV